MENWEVDFDMTVEDAIAFYERAFPGSRQERDQKHLIMIASAFIVVVAGLLIGAIIGPGFPLPWTWFFWIAAPTIFAVLVSPRFVYSHQMKRVAGYFREGDGRKQLGWNRVKIAPNGVTRKTNEVRAEYSWNAIVDVVATMERVYLTMDNLSCILVPCRAFSDEATFQAFVDKCRQYQRSEPPELERA